MSIDSSSLPLAGITTPATGHDIRTRAAGQHENIAGQPRATSTNKSDVTLSRLTNMIRSDDSQDIDYARVARIRTALQAGELPVEPEKIANALLRDIFQF